MDKKSFLAAGVSVLLVAAVCFIPTLNRSRSAVLSSDVNPWYYTQYGDGSYAIKYDADYLTKELSIPADVHCPNSDSSDSGNPAVTGTYPMRFFGFRLRYQSENNPFRTYSAIFDIPINDGKLKNLQKVTMEDGAVLTGPCFEGCINLTEVRLPADLTEIPNGCFHRCDNLASVEIPPHVSTIGNMAFHCSGLKEITLPPETSRIKSNAFGLCEKLHSVTVLNPNCVFDDADGIIFYNSLNPGADQTPRNKKDIQFSGTIFGYTGSTAEAYAEKYGLQFSSLGSCPEPVTTAQETTTEPAETTVLNKSSSGQNDEMHFGDSDGDGNLSVDEAIDTLKIYAQVIQEIAPSSSESTGETDTPAEHTD